MTDIRRVRYCTFLLFVFCQELAGQIPMTCFSSCSRAEIWAAERYPKAEIALLEGKQKDQKLELASLEKDIVFARFNERVSQVRSVFRATNKNGEPRRSQPQKSSKQSKERVQILRQAILDIEKEEKIFWDHLSDLVSLNPVDAELQ